MAAQGLTTLKMGWCKLGADEGAQAVADLLMFNTTLASVDLRGNGLGDAGAPVIGPDLGLDHDLLRARRPLACSNSTPRSPQ